MKRKERAEVAAEHLRVTVEAGRDIAIRFAGKNQDMKGN